MTPIKSLLNQPKKAKVPGSKALYLRFRLWLGLGVGGGAIALGSLWWSIEGTLPPPAEMFASVRENTLTIEANGGTILQQQGQATREPLKLVQIP